MLSSRGGGSTIEAQETRDRRSPMNTALLVLRIIPGLLLMGHGLQKLLPPGYSPPLLHAAGHRGTGAGFESLGIRPGVAAAVLAGPARRPPRLSPPARAPPPRRARLPRARGVTPGPHGGVPTGVWLP